MVLGGSAEACVLQQLQAAKGVLYRSRGVVVGAVAGGGK